MPTRSKVFQISTALFLVASLIFLYCFLFIAPFVPTEGNGIGDSLLYLAPGQRMYQGEMIYRDVFEFVTPGTAIVNFLMFKIFGLRPWISRFIGRASGTRSGLAWRRDFAKTNASGPCSAAERHFPCFGTGVFV